MPKRAKTSPVRPAWQWQEVPVLDESVCTGCRLCCDLCPTDCLEMRGPLPWLPRPADCISCSVCALVCPASALRMMVPEYEEAPATM